ncbi:flavodoxin [Levilactobacillus humaensis]|uniref:flavodoxin n=1 Tax=Levilactobacillus humaensis TaxID=2950375 RepID=UPI0021C30A66|nr:flavodoxin [Levilactobacillus humaensis]
MDHSDKGKNMTNNTTNQALILYYSNSGNTKRAAETLQAQTGADMQALTFSPAYPKTYLRLGMVTQRQLKKNSRPKITNDLDLKPYQIIYLGFPTWFHRPPMFVNTFFETADIQGKVIVPFTTSASSQISESTPFLNEMAKTTGADVQTGFAANDLREITNYLKTHQLID